VARKRGKGIIVLAAVAVLGVVGYATLSESGKTVKTAESGGGSVPASAGPPAPYSISTLGPIGTAAQDPGGGGGGTGVPGNVAPPGIQGAQGSGGAQGRGGNDGKLYLNGTNLLDPSRSSVTSGQVTVPNPLTSVGGVVSVPGQASSTGCAKDASSADYYAIPLKVETVGFSGTPSVRIRISGAGSVTVRLEQQTPDGSSCQTISSGSGTISGGVASFSLTRRNGFQFSRDYTPALVISAPAGSHTISTDASNPSYIALPGLSGV
jgi:hypothetical protein